MSGVLAVPGIMRTGFSDLGQSQRAVELPAGEQAEIHPQALFPAFTHWILRFLEPLNRVIPIQMCNYTTQIPLALKTYGKWCRRILRTCAGSVITAMTSMGV